MKMMMMLVGALSAGLAFGAGDLKTTWETGKRAETLDWFRREMFGYAPPRPADETFDDEGVSFAGGKIKIRVHRALPKGACAENPAPVFLLLDHYNGAERKDGLWHRPGTPTNSITARGYAYVNVNLNDVALNCYDDRWSNKVHAVYGGGKPDSWGTLSAWAWGVSRVMDWIGQRPELDATRVAVVGHSRGGKTALWAAAQDGRIAMAVPNGSGTGGARLMDMNLPKAEPLDWMLDHSIKFWFCTNFQKYKGRSRDLPHDADDLIRLVCPRLVYVGSGSEDDWAGPRGEFEAAKRASDLWRAYGEKGLALAEFPEPGSWSNEGRVGYMLHDGPHQLTAWNWERLLDFADKHMKSHGATGPYGNADDQFRGLWDMAPGAYETFRDMGFNTVINGELPEEAHEKMKADGIGYVLQLGVPHEARFRQKYPRYNRNGQKDERTMDPTEPGALGELRARACAIIGKSVGAPTFLGVQPASELRIFTRPSFTARHAADYKAFSGQDVPALATGRAAPKWATLKDLPADRLIDDTYGVYSFYRWFWTKDDGFTPYLDAVVDEAERMAGRELFSMYDPCIRCPPVWGSGGKVTHLNEWQTTQPDPFQHSYIVSKQQAMARGRTGQKVLTMVQGIFARGDSSPQARALAPGMGDEKPAWAMDRPNASHVTPPRDMMREAFWSVFTRKLDGICVHGWSCLIDGVPHGRPKDGKGYQFTDPTTAPMISDLFHNVAIPLGPLFKTAGERAPEVAVLETLPSALLSGNAPYDWKQYFDVLRAGIVATGANLAPYTLMDDEILRDGVPASVKVILAPEAAVLTKRVAARLKEFQARGGKILARPDFAPGMKADGALPPTRFDDRPGNVYGYDSRTNVNYSAEAHDADLRQAVREFRAATAPYVTPYADTDNPWLLAASRHAGDAADLFFVYNVKRTYGDYMGPWKAVLDKGAPNKGAAWVRREAGAVYDLVRHRPVPFVSKGGRTSVDVSYGSTDGNVFLVAPKPLGALRVTVQRSPEGLHVAVRAPEKDVMRPISVSTRENRPRYGVVADGQWEHVFPAGVNEKDVCVADLATGELFSPVPEKGFRGRVLDLLERVDELSAAADGPDDKTFTLNAWRGERVHVQGVVWSKENQGALALASGDFTGASGAKIPASAVTGRFLRTVETRVRSEKRSLWRIGDCLDPKASAWPKEGYRVFWFTVDVPADAAPGGYSCTFTVKGKGGPLDFPVQLIVSPKTLPAPKDRKFFLDVWQHPWSVAEHAGVKPFSPEHYTLMEPFYRELAAAGQRVIGTTILDFPWGEGYGEGRGEIRDMVKTFRRADGGFRYDFTTFDEFVAFAKRCGVGPQIHCYTIVKFNNKRRFYFTDEKTGKADSLELMEGTPEYEAFLTPLLTALRDHLKGKGWLQDAYIAIDEARPERLVAPRKFLKRVAPELKFALASNIDPLLYKELDADTDVFSQILWTGHGITTLFTPAFDAFMAARRKAGKITTFYVCTQPQKPNTWFESPLAETAWLGLYAAAKGWDGFLRWATFYWPKDPFGAPCQKGYPAGEDFFLYPGSLASARWEILRDAIENWEKIRVLRESGQAAPQLEKALKALDYLAVNEDPPESTHTKVKAVLDQLR